MFWQKLKIALTLALFVVLGLGAGSAWWLQRSEAKPSERRDDPYAPWDQDLQKVLAAKTDEKPGAPAAKDAKRPAADPVPAEKAPPLADPEPHIAVAFTPESGRFGLATPRLMDPRRPGKPKLLTRDERGLTGNTCIWVEGFQNLFGTELPGMKYVRDDNDRPMKYVKVDDNKWMSAMEMEATRIRITRTVEIVRGDKSGLLDTALVRYEIWNRDTKAHEVGLREMIDAYIGATDGVPFEIAPSKAEPKGSRVDSMRIFEKKDVPEYVRAVEGDGKDAVTAELGLKLTGACEPLHRFVICRWPENSEVRWDWKYTPMNQPPQREKDSCVVLYWEKKEMKPQEKRVLAYTYGLGRLSKLPEK